MNWKKGIGIVAVLAVLGFVAYSIFGRETEPQAESVRTGEATEEAITETVLLSGLIEPQETQELMGQGIVSEVNAAVGEDVAEDDALVTYVDGTILRANMDGTVTEVNVSEDEPDMNAQSGQPSIVVADLDNLQVAVSVSKSDSELIEEDQSVELTYGEDVYDGTVSHIDPVATTEQTPTGTTTAQQAVINIDSEADNLVAGFDIDAEVIVASKDDAIVIPLEALMYNENNEPYVFTVENGTAKQTPIQTGIQSNTHIEVTEGVSAGTTVILSPNEAIEDGTAVTANQE
ncbi:efflux RND transporter periplasmic adaptor subunit [Atopococcus tabaci]|uniref:efflux RND transporter periplasmic adaptor subunit n=1 Tax=Atopococcus tabaci TaxID=269774 RepID=UPI00240A1673|nr:HlyD family efflux transporter periplasmic adaptor subunit [Atopococcus tabaci]